jgi:hypothetical protein
VRNQTFEIFLPVEAREPSQPVSNLKGINGSSCDAKIHGDEAEVGGSYLVLRKSTVASRAVPLTACSGDTSWKGSLFLHRAVVKRCRISTVLQMTRFDDEAAREARK